MNKFTFLLFFSLVSLACQNNNVPKNQIDTTLLQVSPNTLDSFLSTFEKKI